MSISGFYNIGAGSDVESTRTIHRALNLGVTHLDTAEIYGPYRNEELVGRAIKGRRDQVVLATKFGIPSQIRPPRLVKKLHRDAAGHPRLARTVIIALLTAIVAFHSVHIWAGARAKLSPNRQKCRNAVAQPNRSTTWMD